MCQVGDIILVKRYVDNGKQLDKHSFVVIDDEKDTIKGLPYDMICNVLSSFKDANQKNRKMAYPGNFPIASDDTVTNPHNKKNGYIKTDQLYYFNKNTLNYSVIGYIKRDILDLVFEYVEESDFQILHITDNL